MTWKSVRTVYSPFAWPAITGTLWKNHSNGYSVFLSSSIKIWSNSDILFSNYIATRDSVHLFVQLGHYLASDDDRWQTGIDLLVLWHFFEKWITEEKNRGYDKHHKAKYHDLQHHQYQISPTQMSCFSNYILIQDLVHPFTWPVLTGTLYISPCTSRAKGYMQSQVTT